ncbi:hypothetical protein SALWKB12_0087 [Snodgrassella communis]|nr:hypothetical protein SALWKB12_0087 [Snodgrassella communis]
MQLLKRLLNSTHFRSLLIPEYISGVARQLPYCPLCERPNIDSLQHHPC